MCGTVCYTQHGILLWILRPRMCGTVYYTQQRQACRVRHAAALSVFQAQDVWIICICCTHCARTSLCIIWSRSRASSMRPTRSQAARLALYTCTDGCKERHDGSPIWFPRNATVAHTMQAANSLYTSSTGKLDPAAWMYELLILCVSGHSSLSTV